jgi:predicted nucleic-acid-binding Zn-ribbon protein
MRRPAPPCPECGGARFWYGSVEFWVGGSVHGSNDQLNVAVCGNCGYSSLYLQNMTEFRQALANMGTAPPSGSVADAPGVIADASPDRSEIKAFRRAARKQNRSERP